jgi:tetratricopeptide (TPR) repeat protein
VTVVAKKNEMNGLGRRALAHSALLVFVVALVPRLIFLLQLRAQSPTFDPPEGGDSILYDRLASGAPEPLRAYFHSPLYIGFLKAFYSVAGRNLFAVRLVQHLLGALACALVVHVTRRAFGSRVLALGAGLLSAVMGPVLFYEGQIGLDALMPLLALVCVTFALSLGNGSGSVRWGFTGIAIGVTALCRPIALVWIPLLVVWAVFNRDHWVRHTGAMLIGAALCIAPITLHNLRAEGDFVLITANGGLNFYIGNNEIANGEYVLPPGLWFRPGDTSDDFEGRKVAEESEGRPLTSRQSSDWWVRRSWAFIRLSPWRVVTLAAEKAGLLLNNVEITQLQDYDVYREVAPVLRLLPTAAFVTVPGVAGILLLLLAGPRRRAGLGLATLVIAFAAGFLPFFVVGRFRAPLLPFLAPFAAFWVARMITATRAREWRPLVIGVLTLLPSLWVALRDVPKPSPAYQYMDFARAALLRGDREGAKHWCRRSDERDPTRVEAAGMLGHLLAEEGRYEEAEKLLTSAVMRDPQNASTRHELGHVFVESGRSSEGIEVLRASLDIDPSSVGTWRDLAEAFRRAGKTDEATAAERSVERLQATRRN